MRNWTEKTFYRQFLATLGMIKVICYMEYIILTKKLFLIWKQVFERFCFGLDGQSKMQLFHFYGFLTSFSKNLMKKPLVFRMEIQSSHKLLFFCKNLRSRNFWERSYSPLKLSGNLNGKDILSVILRKFTNATPNLQIQMQLLHFSVFIFMIFWPRLPKILWKNYPFL